MRPLVASVLAVLVLAARTPAASPAPVAGEATVIADDEPSANDTDVEQVLRRIERPREALIRLRPLRRARDRLRDLRDRLDARTGLRFGATFTTVLQHAPTVGNPNDAWVGTFDLLGRWRLIEHPRFGRGALAAQFRVRENWGATTGNDLSTHIGLPWSINNAGSGSYERVNQLYWEHWLFDDHLTVTAGRIDQTNFFDRNRVSGSGATQFVMSPLVNNQTISFPANGSGINFEATPWDWLTLTAGIGDANGDPNEKPKAEFSGMFDEIFTAAEIGVEIDLGRWHPTLGTGHYRLLGWHTDDTGDPAVGVVAEPNRDGGGVALSIDQEVGESWVTFLRTGHSPNGGLRTETEVSLGLAWTMPFGRRSDFAAVGGSWGDVIGTSHDQVTAELFYRTEVIEGVSMTPDVQILFDPRGISSDLAVILGLRMRFVF